MTDMASEAHFAIVLDGESIGRLFMPNAGTYEVVPGSPLQEEYVIDSLNVVSPSGKCRLVYSEWEEDGTVNGEKWWVMEYAVELAIGSHIAYGTYRHSYSSDQGESAVIIDRLRADAENDFMLCCKLIGRSVRRDLVIDEDIMEHANQSQQLH